jgi:hypothetical protein
MPRVADVQEVDDFDDSTLNTEGEEVNEEDAAEEKSVEAEDETEDETEAEAGEETEEVEAAPKAEAEAEEEAAPRKREPRLPKSRYDFQASKRKEAEARADQLAEQNEALQAELQRLQSEQQKQDDKITGEVDAIEEQISSLDVEVEQLRLDGRTEDAAKKQGEIRKLERKLVRLENKAEQNVIDAERMSEIAVQRVRREVALDAAVEEIETAYPELNKDNERFDADSLEEVMDVYEGLMAKGTEPATALRRATGYVLGSPVSGAKSPAKRSARKQDAVKRNVTVAKKQPPDLKDVGYDGDKGGASKTLDIMQMSIEEFEKLDEDQFLT